MPGPVEVYRGRTIQLFLEPVDLPNGRRIELEIVHHPGAAAIAAVDDELRVTLIRQFRHAAGGYIWELPAGKLDAGEPPLACAIRELREETGLHATDVREIGSILTTPGFCNERIHLFLAQGLSQGDSNLQDDEVLTVSRFPLEEALAMIRRGEIRDARSIAGLFLAAHEVA